MLHAEDVVWSVCGSIAIHCVILKIASEKALQNEGMEIANGEHYEKIHNFHVEHSQVLP